MASIESITLDAADPWPPTASTPPPLIVSQPATVNGFIGALDAGVMPMKPAAKSFATAASYRSRTDDLAVSTSAKRDTGSATRQIDEIVILLGVADVAASKRFYVDRGLAAATSFGRKDVELATPSSPARWRSTDAVP
jgi:hypothetical protein